MNISRKMRALACFVGLLACGAVAVRPGVSSSILDGESVPSDLGEASAVSMQATPTTAEANAAAEIEAEEEKGAKSLMLLKPPGCRPTTQAELYAYEKKRAACASVRPSPSAESDPPTQVTHLLSLTSKLIEQDPNSKLIDTQLFVQKKSITVTPIEI